MAKYFINQKLESRLSESGFFNEILKKDNQEPKIISFVNPFSYSLIAKNEYLINEIDHWFVDGLALCYLTNLRRNKKITRASFDLSSVGRTFLEYAAEKNKKVAFIGGTEGEIHTACNNLQILFPNLNITYQHHGFIKNNYEKMYSKINDSGANNLVIGMGTPIQEEFAIGCMRNCPNLSLIFTCGGFLTQTAIKPDYYHPLIKKLGLRWLQRAYLHKHVRRRLLRDYPKFIIRYLLNK